jgi:hypothetical protein
MWSTYDKTTFPIVTVELNGQLNNDENYNHFIREWTELYQQKDYFKFVFDTSNCGYVNLKYALKMPSYIKRLKELETQYLEKSIIIYDSIWIKMLLIMIFKLQSPVAPVYLVAKDNFCDDMIDNTSDYMEHFSVYNP